jgi:hypothetical protein
MNNSLDIIPLGGKGDWKGKKTPVFLLHFLVLCFTGKQLVGFFGDTHTNDTATRFLSFCFWVLTLPRSAAVRWRR